MFEYSVTVITLGVIKVSLQDVYVIKILIEVYITCLAETRLREKKNHLSINALFSIDIFLVICFY